MASEAAAQVDQRARAALEPLPDLPGQLPLPTCRDVAPSLASAYPEHLRAEVERYLETLRFSDESATSGLDDAMRYSLLAGGKRIRPVLALATAEAIGRRREWVLPLAAALELIHTYSLIHDDLPAMDDDDLRRGPSDLPPRVRRGRRDPGRRRPLRRGVRAAADRPGGRAQPAARGRSRAGRATGVKGMVGGQYIDVAETAPDGPAGLRRLHELKTGRLIAASIECVLLLAGTDEPDTITGFRTFAGELGVLFQIVDDILDVTGSEEALGKPQGSDERLGKRTYVTEFGLDGARRLAARVAPARPRGAGAGRARPGHRARADHRLHRHPELLMTDLLQRIDKPAGPPRARATRSSSRSPRRCASTSSTPWARSAATSAPTSAPARSPSRCTRCSTPRATRSSGTSATRPTRTRSSPAAATSCTRSASTRAWRRSARSTSPRTTSWAPATPRPRSATRSGSRRRCARGHGEDGHVVAVVGDGAMTGGVAFEAVHQAGGEGTPIVVLLNDNGMSIAPNVGALSRYFNRVRLNPKLWHAREGVEGGLTKLPAGIGSAFERLGPARSRSRSRRSGRPACGGRSSTSPTWA